MFQKPLTLAQALKAARDTRHLEISAGAIHAVPRVFRDQFGNRPAIVVADAITFATAARQVHRALLDARQACLSSFVFGDPSLYAEHQYVEELQSSLRKHEAIPVAVGAGTINDVVKLAAHRAGRPYLCVATAASMDGYTAFGASITYQGSKQTFNCPAQPPVLKGKRLLCTCHLRLCSAGSRSRLRPALP